LRAVDVDIDCPELADKVRDTAKSILGKAPIRYRSDSSRHLMLYRAEVGEPKKVSISGSLGKVEVLGRGQQFVAYGAHTDGEPYYWEPLDFASYHFLALNPVSEDSVAKFLKEISPIVGYTGCKLDRSSTHVEAQTIVSSGVTNRERAYAIEALRANSTELANKTANSGRNTALNKAAYILGQMVGAGWIGKIDVENALLAASKKNGYEAKDGTSAVRKTLESGLASGILNPTTALPSMPILDSVRQFAKDMEGEFTRNKSGDVNADIANVGISANSDLIIYRVSDVESEAIRWLWPQRFALGKLTLVSGDPGLGKSQLMAFISAIVSNGGNWPNSEGSSPKGSVLLLSCEDDIADTIRPRLEAAGADLTAVHVIEAVKVAEGQSRSFSITQDIVRLENAILSLPNVKLLIVDPITAYLAGTDTHRTADVRSALSPLQALASRFDIAVIAVSHLNKAGGGGKSVNAVTGSGAFVAAARASFLVAKDSDDESRRLFLQSKNNVGNAPGLSYKIEQKTLANQIVAPYVLFDNGTISTTADEALNAVVKDTDSSSRREAEEFLRIELAAGGLPSNEIFGRAASVRISESTLRRAAKTIGVVKIKSGFDGGWVWQLAVPPKMANLAQDGRSENVSAFANIWTSSERSNGEQ
jgi:putative DNA primase/helicase